MALKYTDLWMSLFQHRLLLIANTQRGKTYSNASLKSSVHPRRRCPVPRQYFSQSFLGIIMVLPSTVLSWLNVSIEGSSGSSRCTVEVECPVQKELHSSKSSVFGTTPRNETKSFRCYSWRISPFNSTIDLSFSKNWRSSKPSPSGLATSVSETEVCWLGDRNYWSSAESYTLWWSKERMDEIRSDWINFARAKKRYVPEQTLWLS